MLEQRSEPVKVSPLQLTDETTQENPTPPKPKKPKWEQEEIVQIGKSIILMQQNV